MFRTALLFVGFLQLLISISSARTVPAKFERALLPEIVLSSSTVAYVRFQAPRFGQSSTDARVTTLNWNSNVASVTSTCRDFFNSNGNNDQLWRSFDIPTLQYAGLFSAPCLRGMVPQSGLDADNVAVSVILPSGVAKLQTIGCDTTDFGSQDRQAVSGIFGISGTLAPGDYAYTTVGNNKQGLVRWKESPPPSPPASDGGFLRLALIDGNGNTVPINVPLIR